MITTEAWVLREGPRDMDPRKPVRAELEKATISFPDITEHEVLAEPLYGCWEANMDHALSRSPIDICRARGEEHVVLGTSGVIRIAKVGAAVTRVKEGDVCLLVPMGAMDEFGYCKLVYGYDAPNSVGVLARQIKIHERLALPLPRGSAYAPAQWAASPRYWSAWSNWKVAIRCWESQMSTTDLPTPHVWGWGGGVALTELELARRIGCRTAMTASMDRRLAQIRSAGITPIDRRHFPDLDLDPVRYQADKAYRARYKDSEDAFLALVHDLTEGHGVSIFIDNIGTPVYRATLKALGRQGVIATAGWKHGMRLEHLRANECIGRHIHVNTHVFRYEEARECMHYQEQTGWIAEVDHDIYAWDDIPRLAQDYTENKLDTYFPLFRVNPE